MTEASDSILNTTQGPAVHNIIPANHQSTKRDATPWADAYLCHTFSKADSLSGDTLVLVLDTRIDDKLADVKYPSDYWTSLKKAPKFTRCRVLVLADELVWIKKAHYKFASVQLITDDGLK